MPIYAIDHVLIAMPEGGEEEARAFYGGVLGLPEVEKPESLKGRSGVWFRQPGLHVDLGVDPDFKPATKAHVGLLTDDLDGLIASIRAAGLDFISAPDVPGYRRIFTFDPFGNRLELLENLA